MTEEVIQNFENIAVVIIVAVGVLCGIEIGKAFSFWKW
jgi:hypothetical protein